MKCLNCILRQLNANTFFFTYIALLSQCNLPQVYTIKENINYINDFYTELGTYLFDLDLSITRLI